ncbi:uncharacterized protein LOC124822089 isoform X4 [Vigna umbellata]|uniref:uncharacterized protein LOC124822089 isoform X4 n=1 Tax=Vigna umbellata TaxID=87088 RepID=UPI001F5E70F4|nr:uncharacterized protein LOC124822089 isoform X4 [Vigna umbellata]
MDPLEVQPPWVPEDDLLLKNAVEAGASLESLARGAVRFSRRYSFRELQDRWLSLLYDGDVSTEAALAMRNLELAKSAAAGGEGSGGSGGEKRKFQNTGGVGKKMKFQSVRKQYCSMQKKLRRHRSGVMSSEGIAANPLGASCGDQHFDSDPRNNAALSAVAQSPHSEHSEGFMICVLNTEHPDIPCNVNLDVSVVIPELAALKSQPVVKEAGFSESAINNQRRNGPDGSLKKEAVLSQSIASKNSSYKPVVFGLKSENPGRNAITAVSRQNNNVDVNPSHGRSVRATVKPALHGYLKQEENFTEGVSHKQDIDDPVAAHVKAEEHKALSKSEAKSLSLDQEGGDIEDDGEDDYDDYCGDELPYFSDVETMILEMDLSPMDQDPNARREVLRYQHEESRKTIMRLEQGAQSSMGRAIRAQGALAVVYGRILKEYIRKSKVVLGRATNDVHVDIDLGKEGEEVATKISRRQALIKLDADGSFIIKNLGKRSIFLNGKEIATGQARGLGASSVIEIRGISLIFETNNRCVKRFLENVNEKV